MPLTYIIEDLTCKEIVGTFYKEKLQKTNQTEFRIEEKGINCMLSGNATTQKVMTKNQIVMVGTT